MPTDVIKEEVVLDELVNSEENSFDDEVKELLTNIDKKLENIEKVISDDKPLKEEFYNNFSDFLTEYKENQLTSFTETTGGLDSVNNNIVFTNHLLYVAIVIALAIYIWGLFYKFIKIFI